MSTANRGVPIGPPRFKIAVHAVVWLARSGGVLSSAAIAGQVDSHATFLRRVMQTLANAGLVESKGGREGGYALKASADQMTLADIYAATQAAPSEELLTDSADCGEAGEQLDVELEAILHEAEQRTIAYLGTFTIADVMKRVELFH